jgi:transposase
MIFVLKMKSLNTFCARDVKLLMTIPGIGYYSALLVKSEIGDVSRFPFGERLCSYAGLVPSTHASGNTVRHRWHH